MSYPKLEPNQPLGNLLAYWYISPGYTT